MAQETMFRITPLAAPNGTMRLTLEGRLSGDYVEQVRALVANAFQGSHLVALDLTEVPFVDPEGVRLLRELVARGVELHGVSSFMSLLLGLR